MVKVKLENVRVAFADGLFNAKVPKGGGTAAFSCNFLFPPGHPAEAAVNAGVVAAAKACKKWKPEQVKGILTQLKATDRLCIHDGDLKPDYEGFPGNWNVAARNKKRPLLMKANKEPLTESDGILYSGCYVNAIIDVWAQDNAFGKRINATVAAVQFLRKGDAFGGGTVVIEDDDFGDVSDVGTDESAEEGLFQF